MKCHHYARENRLRDKFSRTHSRDEDFFAGKMAMPSVCTSSAGLARNCVNQASKKEIGDP